MTQRADVATSAVIQQCRASAWLSKDLAMHVPQRVNRPQHTRMCSFCSCKQTCMHTCRARGSVLTAADGPNSNHSHTAHPPFPLTLDPPSIHADAKNMQRACAHTHRQPHHTCRGTAHVHADTRAEHVHLSVLYSQHAVGTAANTTPACMLYTIVSSSHKRNSQRLHAACSTLCCLTVRLSQLRMCLCDGCCTVWDIHTRCTPSHCTGTAQATRRNPGVLHTNKQRNSLSCGNCSSNRKIQLNNSTLQPLPPPFLPSL